MLKTATIHSLLFSYLEEISRAHGIHLSYRLVHASVPEARKWALLNTMKEVVPLIIRPHPSQAHTAHRPQGQREPRKQEHPSRLGFSCFPQSEGAYPTQPQKMSSTLPSCMFSRSQHKNFSARFVTQMLCKQPGTTSASLGLKFATHKMKGLGQLIFSSLYLSFTWQLFIHGLALP